MENADNPNTAVADNPTEPANTGSGTSGTDGQAQGGAPDEIFKGIDPQKLPPELKKTYDSMLTDYRGKTAKLSESIKAEVEKATQSYKSKADMYDSISAQEEFVTKWNEYVQKSQANPNQNGDPVLEKVKAQVDEMNRKMQTQEMEQVTNAFAEAVDDKGVKVHPNFDKLNDIMVGSLKEGDSVEGYSLLRAAIELSPGTPQEKLVGGYKKADEIYKAIFEEGRKAGMGRVRDKILNGTLPPTGGTNDSLTITEKKPRNAREALDMAKRGVIVSRD